MYFRRIPLSVEVKKVLRMLMYTLFALLLVSSAYFFVKTSFTAERGYRFREAQFLQRDLESQNRILEQQVLDAQSLTELKKSGTVKNMEEPASPVYVEPPGPLTKK